MNRLSRTTILLLLFLLLGGAATWYLLVGSKDDRTTLAGYDRNFKVEDTARIHRIFLADRQGNQTQLERQGDHWIYNGRWRARPNAMQNLLDAVSRIEMQYKPPQAMVKGMVKDLSAQGIKVELYDRGGKMLRSYYVGGGTADERGTYVILADAEQPYVAHLPGWTGNLRYRYSLKGEEWRDKTVFALQPEDIQSVSIEYPKLRNKSFRLKRQGKGFEVRPFYEVTPLINQPVQNGKVEAFLNGFGRLVAEDFRNELPGRDSIKQLVPFSIITVTNIQGDTLSARLIPIFMQPETEAKTGAVIGSLDVERYFADLSNGDFVMIQHRVFEKIFWAYEFFFDPPKKVKG